MEEHRRDTPKFKSKVNAINQMLIKQGANESKLLDTSDFATPADSCDVTPSGRSNNIVFVEQVRPKLPTPTDSSDDVSADIIS